MLCRPFDLLAARPPVVRAWALLLFVVYGSWAALLALPFTLADGGIPMSVIVAGAVVMVLAVAGTLAALRTTAPVQGAALGSGARALLAYNVTAAGSMVVLVATVGSQTAPLTLLGPVLVAVVVVNALVMWRWGRRALDPWTAWGVLLVVGVVTVGAAAAGLRLPVTVQATVNEVPLTLTAPEGRVLDRCRPVTWDVGVPQDWENVYVRVGIHGLEPHNTVDSGEFSLCPYTNSRSAGNIEQVVLVAPVNAGGSEVHTLRLAVSAVDQTDRRRLLVTALVLAFLPSVVVVSWRG
jgi:hypothetical protein